VQTAGGPILEEGDRRSTLIQGRLLSSQLALTAIVPSLDRRPPVAEPLSHKYSFFFHPFRVC
jgi:hypothetical protein